MAQTVIKVEGLGKRYRRGAKASPDTLRDTITSFSRAPLAALRRTPQDTFWALRDVSLEVREGEVLGLIGRNGAGKTTLLKILSRITRPTTGWAEIRGRVRSLLEVGTGFHGELTGRENTYLSGSILGMAKREIDRKFDEIVAFAEIEDFIDTPVKHYSSGMYVRLAFAVAAHLEPEILLVDEVLAVGDVAFQKKCLGKMGEVAGGGRTIVFVSHNMTAMRSLCSRAFLLEDGRIAYSGPVGDCIDHYLMSIHGDMPAEVITADIPRPHTGAGDDETMRITRVRLETDCGHALLYSGRPFVLTMDFKVTQPVSGALIAFAVHSSDGLRIFECRSFESYGPISQLMPGQYTIRCKMKDNPLNPGLYTLVVGSRCEEKGLDYLPDLMTFRVELPDKMDSIWLEERSGLVRETGEWSLPMADVCESRQ